MIVALAFNFLLYRYALWKFPGDMRLMATLGFDPQAAAAQAALEFLTGCLVEYSLAPILGQAPNSVSTEPRGASARTLIA